MTRQIQTATRAALTREADVPDVRVGVMRPRAVAPGQSVARYVTNQGRHAQFKIMAIADDPEDFALTKLVLGHHPRGVLRFTNWNFDTPHTSVAQWLDKRIALGIFPGIMRDSIDMRLRCEFCDHAEVNTPDGREKLSRHRIEQHADIIYGAIPFLAESEFEELEALDG